MRQECILLRLVEPVDLVEKQNCLTVMILGFADHSSHILNTRGDS